MCWLIAGRRSGPVKWALHVYVFDFVYALVFVFLFVFVFVFVWFIDVLGLIVWERSGYVKWPLHHPPHSRILHKHQTMRKHCPSHQYRHHHWPCTSLIVVQNTISHDTSPCSFSHQSARSLSQVGGLMLPYANIVPGVPKKVVNRILRALLVGQVFRPKWPKITLSCPNSPR